MIWADSDCAHPRGLGSVHFFGFNLGRVNNPIFRKITALSAGSLPSLLSRCAPCGVSVVSQFPQERFDRMVFGQTFATKRSALQEQYGFRSNFAPYLI